jgi:hypothetical protein
VAKVDLELGVSIGMGLPFASTTGIDGANGVGFGDGDPTLNCPDCGTPVTGGVVEPPNSNQPSFTVLAVSPPELLCPEGVGSPAVGPLGETFGVGVGTGLGVGA